MQLMSQYYHNMLKFKNKIDNALIYYSINLKTHHFKKVFFARCIIYLKHGYSEKCVCKRKD